MAQHDLVIDNASGATVRADINSALAALGSTMKGPSAPPAPLAGMGWIEDDNPSSTRWTLRVYDGATWIPLGIIDTTTDRFEASSSAVGLALLFATDAAAARAAISAPALPTNSAGVGNFILINPGNGAGYTLPAGGTWAALVMAYAFPSGTYLFVQSAQISAGGTVLATATAGAAVIGFAWRIN